MHSVFSLHYLFPISSIIYTPFLKHFPPIVSMTPQWPPSKLSSSFSSPYGRHFQDPLLSFLPLLSHGFSYTSVHTLQLFGRALNANTTAQKSCTLHNSAELSHPSSFHLTLHSTQSTIALEVGCISIPRTPCFLFPSGMFPLSEASFLQLVSFLSTPIDNTK